MFKVNLLIILLSFQIYNSLTNEIKLSLGPDGDSENNTFVATEEWQEIKPGQKVPQGLHYRMNLQTGKTEAKLLDPNENANDAKQTSLTATKSDVENEEQIETSRQRLEEALKNIPSEKFDDVTEEKWKEVSKKFRSYEQIKEELSDVDLSPKTEAEVMQQLIDEFFNENIENSRRLDVLKDLEFLMHSIDNSLLFISNGGLEKIVIPNLINQTDVNVKITLLKMFGAMMQNNPKVKKYVSEKTNLGHEVLNILSKSESIDEVSACLYAIGSLMRNNKILSPEIIKKSIVILLDILNKSTLNPSNKSKDIINLTIKAKDLMLISDLITEQNFDVENLKVCDKIAEFFEQHRNPLIVDTDAAEKCAAALLSLQACSNKWSESPMFRHTLLVVMNNYKVRLNEESDEDLKFMYELVMEHLENLNKQLYGNLKISDDDLTQRYQGSNERDEL